MLYNEGMKTRNSIVLPGYLTVAGAADRLRLAPRSVRDLIYAGRLPSARLGRRHFLKIPDVEAERRRRLGLPLPQPKPSTRRRSVLRQQGDHKPTSPRASRQLNGSLPAVHRVNSDARRERSAERAAQFERWLRTGNLPSTPRLPFTTIDLGTQSDECAACRRTVRSGGGMVDADAAEGRPSARLCLTCARRALLAWADNRRREGVAARRLARDLGAVVTSPPLIETVSAA